VSSLIDEAKVALAQGDFSRHNEHAICWREVCGRSSNAETQEQRFSKTIGKSLALRVSATLPELVKSRATAWGLGVIVVTLITAGAVRATIPNMSAAVTERAAPKPPTSTRPEEMLSTTMPKRHPRF
jgi:hypothetical protein